MAAGMVAAVMWRLRVAGHAGVVGGICAGLRWRGGGARSDLQYGVCPRGRASPACRAAGRADPAVARPCGRCAAGHNRRRAAGSIAFAIRHGAYVRGDRRPNPRAAHCDDREPMAAFHRPGHGGVSIGAMAHGRAAIRMAATSASRTMAVLFRSPSISRRWWGSSMPAPGAASNSTHSAMVREYGLHLRGLMPDQAVAILPPSFHGPCGVADGLPAARKLCSLSQRIFRSMRIGRGALA